MSGAINWDTSIFVDRFPSPGEEIRTKKVISVPGGKGANVAVASARILGKNNVGIIGALGNDEIGDRQIRILQQEGVDISCIRNIDNASSGQAYIVVDQNGENVIMTYKAANHMITKEMASDDVTLRAIQDSRIMTVIDPPLEVAGALITNAKKMDKLILWSPGLLAREGLDRLRDLLMKIDYLVANRSELSLLTGSNDATKACLELSKMLGGRRVIATLGSEGCALCWDGKTAVIPAIDLAALDLGVVNTVGAGDAFLGAFAALLVKGFGEIESLFMANVAAALKTTKEETRGSPSYDELMRYVKDRRVEALQTRIRVQ